MRERIKRGVAVCRGFVFALIFLALANALAKPTTRSSSAKIPRSRQAKQSGRQDDSLNSKPAADLVLRAGGDRKAGALAHFVEGMAFEENGELDRALDVYRKVLNVDPGQAQLASRVAGLLIKKDEFSPASDGFEETIKTKTTDARP